MEEYTVQCYDCRNVFDEDDVNEEGYCHDCAAYHDAFETDDDYDG